MNSDSSHHRDAEDAEETSDSETAGDRSVTVEIEILCVLRASAVNSVLLFQASLLYFPTDDV
jgi:hypothetical protein